jgi:hypothetical protein
MSATTSSYSYVFNINVGGRTYTLASTSEEVDVGASTAVAMKSDEVAGLRRALNVTLRA